MTDAERLLRWAKIYEDRAESFGQGDWIGIATSVRAGAAALTDVEDLRRQLTSSTMGNHDLIHEGRETDASITALQSENEALRARIASLEVLAEKQSHHYDCRTIYGELLVATAGNASALDAALAQARREERDRCAGVVADYAVACEGADETAMVLGLDSTCAAMAARLLAIKLRALPDDGVQTPTLNAALARARREERERIARHFDEVGEILGQPEPNFVAKVIRDMLDDPPAREPQS